MLVATATLLMVGAIKSATARATRSTWARSS